MGSPDPKGDPILLRAAAGRAATQQLLPDDAVLLEDTMDYFGTLVIKVHRSLYKIRRKCLLHGIVNRSMWIMRQAALEDMDGELYTWTQRFYLRDLRIPLGL